MFVYYNALQTITGAVWRRFNKFCINFWYKIDPMANGEASFKYDNKALYSLLI